LGCCSVAVVAVVLFLQVIVQETHYDKATRLLRDFNIHRQGWRASERAEPNNRAEPFDSDVSLTRSNHKNAFKSNLNALEKPCSRVFVHLTIVGTEPDSKNILGRNNNDKNSFKSHLNAFLSFEKRHRRVFVNLTIVRAEPAPKNIPRQE